MAMDRARQDTREQRPQPRKRDTITAAKTEVSVATARGPKDRPTSSKEYRKTLGESLFGEAPAYVRVSAGVTKNLGNYESLRVDVSVSMPCHVDDIEGTYDRTSDIVAGYLETEVNNYLLED